MRVEFQKSKAQNYIYSVAAASRILGVSRFKVSIQIWNKVVWVHVKGSSPTLISKKVFRDHFVAWRKASGAKIREAGRVITEDGGFIVEGSKDSYIVIPEKDGIYCDCMDYQAQTEYFGKAACKHIYAVLGVLGFDALSDYVNSDRAA